MTLHAGENPLANASVPVIKNLTLTTADFEYSYTLPLNTRKLLIRPRSASATIKLAYVSGESGTNYLSIPPGGYWEDIIGITEYRILYMQSATAGVVAEIISWS